MAKSFRQLEAAETVTGHEVLETLKEYAEDGKAISALVVIKLIDRVASQLSQKDKEDLKRYAELGVRRQIKKCCMTEADEYGWVLDRIVQLL